MCLRELAGDPNAIPILLGLGLDEFSMAPLAIASAKEIVRAWSLSQAKKLATKALEMETAKEVRAFVKSRVIERE